MVPSGLAADTGLKRASSSGTEKGPLVPFDGVRPRSKPVVAASIGSYGAYLADGSEYR